MCTTFHSLLVVVFLFPKLCLYYCTKLVGKFRGEMWWVRPAKENCIINSTFNCCGEDNLLS